MSPALLRTLRAFAFAFAFAATGMLGLGPPGSAMAADGVQPATTAERAAAARLTAESLANACKPIRPFYWEVGDGSGALDGASVDQPGSARQVTADTRMAIASASKWLFGAYVVQRRGGVLSNADIGLLTFRSGYTNFTLCLQRQSVQRCLGFSRNGVQDPGTLGYFLYSGGHMQKHAVELGLGPLYNAGLAAEMQRELGADVGLAYSQPQPAGGGISTAADYARFLRKLLNRELLLGDALGSHAVCTNPLTCPRQALGTPIPLNETWHYSLGHWVEDDPVVGDGAFSSAGAFGFYPWIDASKQFYGIVAREALAGSGAPSMECGRLIRKAWLEGRAQ